MANSLAMWLFPGGAAWRLAYRRVVRSAFATVPLYREKWALDGRTEPTLVPGRTGACGGAITAEEAGRKLVDLVPLAGGAQAVDSARGLGTVLPIARPVPRGTVVVVVDPGVGRPPADLPRGLRGCVLDPEALGADGASTVLAELTGTLQSDGAVLAVGPDKGIQRLVGALPPGQAGRVDRLPHRELDQLDGGPYGVLYDRLLGYLGALGPCGRWHLDWPRVYARATTGGLAFTLLRQRSPRLVDVLLAGGVRGEIAPCPRHGTPVVLT